MHIGTRATHSNCHISAIAKATEKYLCRGEDNAFGFGCRTFSPCPFGSAVSRPDRKWTIMVDGDIKAMVLASRRSAIRKCNIRNTSQIQSSKAHP